MREEILQRINAIEINLKELRSLINGPQEDEVEIAIILDSEHLYGHIWDSRNPAPRILGDYKGDAPKAKVISMATAILDVLFHSPTAIRKRIKWISDLDWSELPEQYRELEKVMQLEKLKMTEEKRQAIKGTINADYHLST